MRVGPCFRSGVAKEAIRRPGPCRGGITGRNLSRRLRVVVVVEVGYCACYLVIVGLFAESEGLYVLQGYGPALEVS